MNKRTLILQASLVGLLFVLSLPAWAQDNRPAQPEANASQSSRGPRPSDLALDNLTRVGASSAQLQAVLVKDPGLLVELKRWIAKDAADYGQIVDDASLTDQAVFDHLERDATFRSVATRLVQKYGYLLPMVNPGSDMAKEQDLILKERAHRQIQTEEREDAQRQEEIQRIAKGENGDEASPRANCDAADQDPANPDAGNQVSSKQNNCRDLTRMRRGQKGLNRNAAPEGQPDYPDFQVPYIPYRTPQAQVQTARDDEDGSGGSGLSKLMASFSGSSGSASGMPGASMGGPLDPSGMGGSRIPLEAMPMMGASGGNNLESLGGRGTASHMIIRRGGELESRSAENDISSVTMIHKRNPYSDIPSLYDLYVQASVQPGKVERFGLEVFRNGTRDLDAVPMDLPVGPDYVVGPGDGLSINLWGGVSQRLTRTVDRQGRIALPEVGPLLVSGRSLGDVQTFVQQALRTQYRDTSADVSLSRLRTVRVYVVGEVAEPGAYDISSLSTPLNALLEAGGVTPRGSLRKVKHYRGKQLVEEVDTYDLLLRGISTDISHLENGDSLVVPPVGALVTVTGMVRRPAVYELNGENSLQDVLELAGGILPAAALRHIELQRLEEHEKRTMLDLNLPENDTPDDIANQLNAFKIKDGDEIHIFPIASYNESAVYLQGHVLRPGKYSYHDEMKLTDLLGSYSDLLPEPSGRYAEIIRLNAPDFRPSVESFDLTVALANPASAPKLQPLDTVRIFSRYDFDPPPIVWVGGDVHKPGQYRTSGQVRLRDAIFLAGGPTQDADLKTAQLFRTEADGKLRIFSVDLGEALNGKPSENIEVFPRDRILIHRNLAKLDPPTVTIKGEVARPGRFPFTSNMRVQDLINSAGGLKRSADTQQADLTRYAEGNNPSAPTEAYPVALNEALKGDTQANLQLRDGDVLSIRQSSGWNDIGATIAIRGEVQHPGSYGIEPGEKLSSVLERAGGFSNQAFPYGALLSRRDVREVEMKNHVELVERLKAEQMNLNSLPENTQEQKDGKLRAIAETQTTLTQLQSTAPIGRVVIHINPEIKEWRGTPADISLRDGDTLVIPKKAEFVLVTGQVYNPTAVGYRPGHSARWYLSQAGGITQVADKKAVFVVRADGSVISAKNNSGGWFSGDPMSATLRPGDSIVVPEKTPKIGNWTWTNTLQTAQMLSSVAIAIAYIHP
jgi:protein involved in polysaccharide export with SLBB domain